MILLLPCLPMLNFLLLPILNKLFDFMRKYMTVLNQKQFKLLPIFLEIPYNCRLFYNGVSSGYC